MHVLLRLRVARRLPKFFAPQCVLRSDLGVNQNVYTRVAFDRQAEAVHKLDSLFRVN